MWEKKRAKVLADMRSAQGQNTGAVPSFCNHMHRAEKSNTETNDRQSPIIDKSASLRSNPANPQTSSSSPLTARSSRIT